ncbi:unnamed protein product [Pieris macdunnoughi]|uniref:L-dopachrome isomerase n=1 Tax=Pieris macdunnoughi TaxID=345717 RepID=A0A821L119_9NEOP|nr:unnamed protein product [Pieris macdunnoughi]
MPCLKVLTNLPNSKIPNDFVNKIVPVLSKSVRKPEQNFIVVISGECRLSFGGASTEYGAVASIESIGNLGPDDNKVITKEVTAFINKELGIKPNNFFLTFYDLAAYNVAKNGDTIG